MVFCQDAYTSTCLTNIVILLYNIGYVYRRVIRNYTS